MTIKDKRIAWCITGSGHYLKESIDIMNQIKNIDLFLSKAGEEVLKWYNYELDDFKSSGMKIFKDVTASSAPVSLLYEGVYKLVVVSPATSNTVAQMAYGLSDNLVSNIFVFHQKFLILLW